VGWTITRGLSYSDPSQDQRRVAVVNFTGYLPFKDGTCRIQIGEHPRITKETCVQYAGCQIVQLAFLEDRKDRGDLVMDVPLSAKLLERIREGAVKSPHAPLDLQAILTDQGLVIQR